MGTLSHEFKNKAVSLFQNELRVTICPVFNTFNVSNYFSLKCQTPKQLLSNVVYKYTCLCDTNITYIGKTKRHMAVRILEHLKYEDVKPESEIKSHLGSCNVCKSSSLDNFEILQKCKTDDEAKIKEAMFILKQNPSLNPILPRGEGICPPPLSAFWNYGFIFWPICPVKILLLLFFNSTGPRKKFRPIGPFLTDLRHFFRTSSFLITSQKSDFREMR